MIEHHRRSALAILAAQIAGAVLIAASARGDLWFDEIWSLVLVQRAGGISGVFSTCHDNNHILNSLYLMLVGNSAAPYIYRLFAVVCGIGSLFVIAHIGRRWGHAEALSSVILVGTSYPLLLYFSEARGYAPAILLALAAYALVGDERTTPARIALFWIVSILGVLAHLTFVIVTCALLFIRRPRYLRFHGVPLLFVAVWSLTFVRHMTFGGGPIYRYTDVVKQTAAMLLGTPESWSGVAVLIVVAIVVCGAIVLRRDGDSHWLFYPVVLLASPIAIVLITHPQYLYLRYFAVTFPFFTLLLARLICRWSRASGITWAAAAIVVTLVAAQSGRVWSLLELGRGQYSTALGDMSAATGAHPIIIGSDNDFRTRMLLSFYVPRLHHPAGVRYVLRKQWRIAPPEWFIAHTQDLGEHPSPMIQLPGGADYVLIDEYDYSGISGWRWFLYRRTVR